ncbi:MAG: hypothetical protein ACFCU1_00115 [Sumerlaeia bacterium]
MSNQPLPILADELVPNCFDPETYLSLDMRTGVIRNRFGTKSILLSGFLLRGIYIGLKNECGPAWKLVLRSCGEIWGEKFAQRFLNEISEFYGQDLESMSMARFKACVEEYFATAGWGKVNIDFSIINKGLIQVEVENPILGELFEDVGEKCDVLFEGVFKKLFSKISKQELDCYETQSVAEGAPTSVFLIGAADRFEDIPEWIEEKKLSHGNIIERLERSATQQLE